MADRISAEELTRAFWEPREAEMVKWLREQRKFSQKGAELCARNFIETMAYVARETGEPQFKRANTGSAT